MGGAKSVMDTSKKVREREREKGKMRLAHELWFGREQWVGAKSVMETSKKCKQHHNTSTFWRSPFV
jgi:hypothetical protein